MTDTSGTPPQDGSTPTSPTPSGTTPPNAGGGMPTWAAGATAGPSSDPGPADQPADAGRRPAWLVPVAVGVGVLVVAGIVVAAVTSGGDDGDASATASPIPTPTVVLPVPTPAVAPAARPDPTAFTSALPDTVLQYAFVSEKPADDLLKAGAVEAVTDTYTDGGSGTLTVDAGQFGTADAAADAAKQLAGQATVQPTSPAAGLPQQGDVMAGGAKVGTYAIVDAGDGQGMAIWTNGTSVFRLVAPVADVVSAYNAFPM